MKPFRLTPLAEQDLTEIVEYVAVEASPDRARAVLLEFMRAFQRLSLQPEIGHGRDDLTDEAVLFWPVYGYLVTYRPTFSPLQIVRIVHGSQNPSVLKEHLKGRRLSRI